MARKRKCRHCGEPYMAVEDGQKVCSVECAIPYGRVLAEAAARRETAAMKKRLRDTDRSWHLKKAQEAFNAFIRERDSAQGLPCISCGRFHNGQWHAGHYRTTAAMSSLRYNELNCHRQCAPCNNHKSGNITEYRIELVRRIGVDLVEWLERDHPPCRWTIPELKGIRRYYEEAVKEMHLTPGYAEPF